MPKSDTPAGLAVAHDTAGDALGVGVVELAQLDSPFGGFLRRDRPLGVRFFPARVNGLKTSVVLCPPLGHDEVNTRQSFRVLGSALGERGITTLSLDYDGTGDSAGGTQDPHRVESWLRSIEYTVHTLRRSGATHVTLVGLRLGALLAAYAAPRCNVDALVIWDAVASGRGFVRAQQALFAFGLFGADPPRASADGSREGPGLYLDAALVDSLASLSFAGAPAYDGPRLVVHRGLEPPGSLRTQARTDYQSTDEQEALVDASSWEARVPVATIERMVGWIAATGGVKDIAPSGPVSGMSPDVVVGFTATAVMEDVRESIVQLTDRKLSAVIAEPLAGRCLTSPTIIFLNTSVEHRIGPGRLWVDLARRWAGLGMRVVRVDLTGLGDSPALPPSVPYGPYPSSAFADLAALSLAYEGDVVFAGVCSGGYHALEATLQLHTRGTIAVNPYLGYGGSLSDPPGAPTRLAVPGLGRRLQAYLNRSSRFVDWLPPLAWRLLVALHLYVPMISALEAMHETGRDSLVIFGPADAYPVTTRGRTTLRRLRRRDASAYRELPGVDHGLLLASSRHIVAEELTDYVCRTWLAEPKLVRETALSSRCAG